MDIRKELGRKLRAAREEAGLSQTELGKRFGVSHAAISDMERGITDIGVGDLLRLAQILHKPLSYFLPGISNEDPLTQEAMVIFAKLPEWRKREWIARLRLELELAQREKARIVGREGEKE